jgi:phytoene/squalene synthetase
MCLRVFCNGDEELYNNLKADARSLGSAFQKVNFLRDLKSDFYERGRVYFPGVDFNDFTIDAKKVIEEDIQNDFKDAYRGILGLPENSRRGVYLAYIYYLKLFDRIKKTSAAQIQNERIRVPDGIKFALLAKTLVKGSFNVL